MHLFRFYLFVSLAAASSIVPTLANAKPAQSEAASTSFQRGAPLPKWAQPLGEIPETNRDDPIVVRLQETQTLVGDSPATLINRAIQVNEKNSLGEIGEVSLNYFPTYQKLLLHRVAILRGGKLIDHTASVSIRMLQRESNMESGMFGGATTVHLLLDDVRIGDTLWLSYTTEGANPVFGKRWADEYGWDAFEPIELRRLTVLHPAQRALYWRQLGDFRHEEIKPRIEQLGGLESMRFEERGIEPLEPEKSVPSDYLPGRILQFSEYPNWQAVASWADGLFPKAGNTAALKNLADQFAKEATPVARASAALHWVQDEVRYFSVSIGENSYRPQAPETVIARRYGDCKDKSYLLVALLSRLGISARPVLLASEQPKVPAKVLATPAWFDHVIVQFDLDGRQYYVDPTNNGQPEPLARLPQPFPGAYGLVVDPSTRNLVVLPAAKEAEPEFEYDERFNIATFDGDVDLESRIRFRGDAADHGRLRFSGMSSRELKSNILSVYEKKYPGTTLVGTPVIKDDVQANVFDVIAQFKVPAPLIHKDARYELEYDSKIIGDSLGVPGKLVRSYPFAVHDGNSRSRYHLRIDWPRTFRTDLPSASKSVESPFFEAHERYSSLGNELDYRLDYEVKVDVVKPEDMAALQGKAKLLREFDEASFRASEAQISSTEFAEYPMADLDSIRAINEAALVERKMQEKRADEVGLQGLCNYVVDRLETYDLQGQDRTAVLRKFRPLLELGRKHDELNFCLGRVAFTRGKFDDAVLYFDKAQMPDKSADTLSLAWARFYAGDIDGAKAVLAHYEAAQGASAEEARDDTVMVDKLALYQRLGMPLPADLQRQAGLMPDGPWPGPLLAMQAGLIGQEDLIETMASYPADARSLAEDMAWFYIGQKALAEQDTARAKSAFERYRSDFNHATGFVNRARIELARLRPADAEFEAGKEDDEMGDRVPAMQRWGLAAHKGSALSQDQLSQEYFYGRNLLGNDGSAFQWAQKAANQDVARAQNLLGVLYDQGKDVAADKQAAVGWFRKAAAQGLPDAQYNLAMKLRTGEGVVKDLQESERLLLASANQGYRDSEIQLARDYLFGFYGRKDYDAVAIWSRRAALQDSNLARVMLARAYLEGKGLNKSPLFGVHIMRQAAQSGDVDANKWMGILYDTGNGVAKNHQVAVQWYETAISFGSPEAKSLLLFGVPAQDPGNPEPVDFHKVFSDTVSAAGAQDAAALYRLGLMYKLGIGTAADQKLAKNSFERAAELGNVDAQVEMGMLYDRGTDHNASRAIAWYEKASNQGSGFAAKNWADMYQNGNDVRQDYGRAFELYTRAVKLGYGFACTNIGSMYLNGWGVKRDPVMAYTYFSIVARENESAVVGRRNDLRQEIGAEKAAQADKVAEAWAKDMPLPGEAKQ